ncbi:MAG: FAD binding domain-containing protein [Nannocystaceae bacterium]
MLRLPPFDVATPATVAEVVRALEATPDARILAGGTDLLPNLKHRLERPPALISLARVTALRQVIDKDDDNAVRIGAGVSLSTLSTHPLVRGAFPSLCEAAERVASPIIRNMATLGGNVHLDTRCRYVNQTQFWRQGIGGCLKAEGDVCHVVPKGRNCVAALSSDCVPVIVALDGSIELVGPEGQRTIPAEAYFRADGLRHTVRVSNEVMTALILRKPAAYRRERYLKWTVRKSIDFPLLSVAMRFDLETEAPDAPVTAVRIVVGVLGAKPRLVGKLNAAIGMRFSDPKVADMISQAVHSQCRPLENIPYDAAYRRRMLQVYTHRAIQAMATQAATSPSQPGRR